MADTSADRWAAGDAYERYMGRWSRRIAVEFVNWLSPASGVRWLDVGCGTGALTSCICRLCEPASVVASDPSASFVEHARGQIQHPAASFAVGAVEALPAHLADFDGIVSGLVINFMGQPDVALAAMRERARPGAVIAAYIWDYAGGLEFLHHFWKAAVLLDPSANALDESTRFEEWTQERLASIFRTAALDSVQTAVISIETHFADFDDYWVPFLGGTGPAPSYVLGLRPQQREELARHLRVSLPIAADGTIQLRARALAVRAVRS